MGPVNPPSIAATTVSLFGDTTAPTALLPATPTRETALVRHRTKCTPRHSTRYHSPMAWNDWRGGLGHATGKYTGSSATMQMSRRRRPTCSASGWPVWRPSPARGGGRGGPGQGMGFMHTLMSVLLRVPVTLRQTNNSAELLAAIRALQIVTFGKIAICTDSEYVFLVPRER